MLPPATLAVARRLRAALMALAHAVVDLAVAGTPTIPQDAAEALFLRITRLVTTLIHIHNFGIRASTARPTQEHGDIAPIEREPGPAASSPPRRPGWLLDALPDSAPAIAAEISLLLADPAFVPLLDIPTLGRTLNPLLRSLGLTLPQAAPPPDAPPPRPPSPEPLKPVRTHRPQTPPRHKSPVKSLPQHHTSARPICYETATKST